MKIENSRTATEVDAFVGAQLKLLRKSEKLSQTDLAKKVGVTFQQIQKYERGTNRIGASRLWEFCQVFDVKPGRFFEGVEAHMERMAAAATQRTSASTSDADAQPDTMQPHAGDTHLLAAE